MSATTDVVKAPRAGAFHWRDNIIYDDETTIARFSSGAARGDCSLNDMVLRPGGRPLLKWIFSWWSQTTRRYTNILDALQHQGTGRSRFSRVAFEAVVA